MSLIDQINYAQITGRMVKAPRMVGTNFVIFTIGTYRPQYTRDQTPEVQYIDGHASGSVSLALVQRCKKGTKVLITYELVSYKRKDGTYKTEMQVITFVVLADGRSQEEIIEFNKLNSMTDKLKTGDDVFDATAGQRWFVGKDGLPQLAKD
jgi:hypothetical protein